MLKVKNWEAFQHYKDRDPPWIKLHRGLLEDYEFFVLPDVTKAHVIMIWLLAARCGNRIPEDASWIAQRIGSKEPIDIETIIASGFLVQADTEKEPSRAEGWGSRYISGELREEVLRVKGHKCLQCGSPENIELDHIKPISKGGQSVLENLQPLCRSCNRSKRAKKGHIQKKSAEQVATQKLESAYSRGRGETEGEKREPSPAATAISEPPAAFLKFWNGITSPRRKGERAEAFEAWKKAGKPEADYLIRQWAAYLASLGETFPKDVCRWLAKGIFRGPFEGKQRRIERPVVSAPLPKPPTPWTDEQQREARELTRRTAANQEAAERFKQQRENDGGVG